MSQWYHPACITPRQQFVLDAINRAGSVVVTSDLVKATGLKADVVTASCMSLLDKRRIKRAQMPQGKKGVYAWESVGG